MSGPRRKSASLANFGRALENLGRSLAAPISEPRDLSGILKDFEMAYELSWKSLKSFLLAQGHETQGARDVFAKAYQLGYLDEESPWLEMIESRNQTAHVYDEAEARRICESVRARFFPALERLRALLTRPAPP